VGDHLNLLERDQTVTQHLVQLRQNAADLLLAVDRFDEP